MQKFLHLLVNSGRTKFNRFIIYRGSLKLYNEQKSAVRRNQNNSTFHYTPKSRQASYKCFQCNTKLRQKWYKCSVSTPYLGS